MTNIHDNLPASPPAFNPLDDIRRKYDNPARDRAARRYGSRLDSICTGCMSAVKERRSIKRERTERMKRKLDAKFGVTSHKELEGALVNNFHRCCILVSVANVF
jgi:hypothetical protein